MGVLTIGIYGKSVKSEHHSDFIRLLSWLEKHEVKACFYEPFARSCHENGWLKSSESTFLSRQELKKECTFLISLGGDGTLLNAASLVGDSEIPVVGLNFGKLGFLAPVDTHFLEEDLDNLCSGNYVLEQRSLLRIQLLSQNDFQEPFALNDITFRSEGFGILSLDVWVDKQFLNTYFGDGLIVSTPTGSTAYNLSCGGPILLPENCNFVLTPIASHTLTVRPLIIPDFAKIEIQVNPKDVYTHVSLDSRQYAFHGKQTFCIEKAPFSIRTIRLRNQHFFDTIRAKLMWGQHARKNH